MTDEKGMHSDMKTKRPAHHDMYLMEQNYIMSSYHDGLLQLDCEKPNYPHLLDEVKKYTDIRICWAGQKDFEQIVQRIAGHARLVEVFSPKIVDLTPLQSLSPVEYIIVDWNQKATRLWDVSANTNLMELALESFRKLTDLSDLATARHITGLYLGGDLEKKWRIDGLEPLAVLANLEVLRLWEVRLDRETFRPLHRLKRLKYINAGTKICATEEYAMLFAALEHTYCEFSSGVFPQPGLNIIERIGKGNRSTTSAEKAQEFSRAFQESVQEYRRRMQFF